jgi:nucleotide-binding universal stress UspA family protein
MRWIVGIDLRERSRGALQMAAWMRTHRLPAAEHDFVGVHVVDETLRLRLTSDLLRSYVEAVEREIARAVDETAVASALSETRVAMAASAEDGLAEAATTSGVEGLLVGRAAYREGRKLVRLGRVARRLLRRLPAPLMVVPPDLSRAEVGSGRIVLATDLGVSSSRAATVAASLASSLGRELEVVHVQDPRETAMPFATAEGFALPPPMTPREPAEVEAWAREQGLESASTRLLEGDTIASLLAHAREASAPIVVCGSRRLGVADRVFTSSVGTDLARLADRAVLIVPPE